MGTWERGGGGSREMAGTRGAGRKHEGLPNRLSGRAKCSYRRTWSNILLQSAPRVAPWVPWGIVGPTLFRGARKTPNGVAACRAVRPLTFWGSRAAGAFRPGVPFSPLYRPVRAHATAAKRNTNRYSLFGTENFVKGLLESDRSSTGQFVDFINAGFMARGYRTELAGCRVRYVLFGSR
jgi:hypothetical protein